MNDDELIVDSFAGGGGASLGIAWALGRAPDIAINHDPSAIEMHAANHPSTEHVLEDVWRADLRKLVGGRKVGLLWLSPDCFAAGTLVLTKNGLVPIEQVVIGDEVLTHLNRWKRVTALVQKESQTIKLKGSGHFGLDVTPDHQIYSQTFALRDRGGFLARRTNGIRWIEAQKMVGKVRHPWATPHSVPAVEFMPPPAEMDANLFYFLGRWVACGSFSKDDVVVSCGYHDAEWTHQKLADNPVKNKHGKEFNIRYRELPDTAQIIIGCAELRRWIEDNFGKLSKNKHIPTWLLGMQASWREAFLEGYVDGDGSGGNVISAGSASKSLALGIKLLATSLGKCVEFHYSPQADSEIDGRIIKGGDYYRIKWREELDSSRLQHIDDERHRFTRVKKILPGSHQMVYCMEVEDDHSFVADGIVVHNCKHFSRAKGAKPVEKKIRSLAWIACKWASEIGPRVIALENVREFADWGPIVPRLVCKSCDWKGTSGQAILMRKNYKCPCCDSKRLTVTEDLVPCPARKGATFKRFVARLRKLGYHVEWRNLDAADYGAPTHRKRLFLIARNDGEPITWPEPTHCNPSKLDDAPLFGQLKPYRTAAECIDWSIECPSIFTRKKPLADKTMRRIALGVKRYVIDASEPFIVQVAHGDGKNGRWNGSGIDEPLGSVTGSNNHAVVCPVVSRYNGSKTDNDDRCHQPDQPFTTLDTQPRFALVSAFIAKHFGGMVGVQVDTPLPTTTMRGTQNQLVAANLVHLNHGAKQWSGADEPMRTVTTGNHAALVYSFLVKYFGTAIGASLHEPSPTATGKDRFGLVTVQVNGEPYVIIDIGMRMLTPRELARAQGFPDTYLLTGTKTSQVARIGNSVCPHVAAAIVRANCVEGVPAL